MRRPLSEMPVSAMHQWVSFYAAWGGWAHCAVQPLCFRADNNALSGAAANVREQNGTSVQKCTQE